MCCTVVSSTTIWANVRHSASPRTEHLGPLGWWPLLHSNMWSSSKYKLLSISQEWDEDWWMWNLTFELIWTITHHFHNSQHGFEHLVATRCAGILVHSRKIKHYGQVDYTGFSESISNSIFSHPNGASESAESSPEWKILVRCARPEISCTASSASRDSSFIFSDLYWIIKFLWRNLSHDLLLAPTESFEMLPITADGKYIAYNWVHNIYLG